MSGPDKEVAEKQWQEHVGLWCCEAIVHKTGQPRFCMFLQQPLSLGQQQGQKQDKQLLRPEGGLAAMGSLPGPSAIRQRMHPQYLNALAKMVLTLRF